MLGVVVLSSQTHQKSWDHQKVLVTAQSHVSHKVVEHHSNVLKPVIGVVTFDMPLVMLIFKMEPHSFNSAQTNV